MQKRNEKNSLNLTAAFLTFIHCFQAELMATPCAQVMTSCDCWIICWSKISNICYFEVFLESIIHIPLMLSAHCSDRFFSLCVYSLTFHNWATCLLDFNWSQKHNKTAVQLPYPQLKRKLKEPPILKKFILLFESQS